MNHLTWNEKMKVLIGIIYWIDIKCMMNFLVTEVIKYFILFNFKLMIIYANYL